MLDHHTGPVSLVQACQTRVLVKRGKVALCPIIGYGSMLMPHLLVQNAYSINLLPPVCIGFRYLSCTSDTALISVNNLNEMP